METRVSVNSGESYHTSGSATRGESYRTSGSFTRGESYRISGKFLSKRGLFAVLFYTYRSENYGSAKIEIKQGAKLQQARLIGASDAVNRRRGALAPAGVGGGFLPTTDGRMAPAAYRGGGHRRLLYTIDMKYVRNLAKADDNVMSVSPQNGKSVRPFVGIIVLVNGRKYCIPLSSPKKKFENKTN